MSLYQTGDYAQALNVLQAMEAQLAGNDQMLLAYFGSMAQCGDYEKGEAGLRSLATKDGKMKGVNSALGLAHLSRKSYALAARELRMALRQDPTDVKAKRALAQTQEALGKNTEALQLMKELAETGSRDPEVFSEMARMQLQKGQAKEAATALETAIRLDTGNATYHRQLAVNTFPQERPAAKGRDRAAKSAKVGSQGDPEAMSPGSGWIFLFIRLLK